MVVPCGSSLDEQLGLGTSQLTPLLAESVVRLGTWLPFRHAATMFTFFSQTALSASSVRRLSEAVGAAGEALLN